MAIRTSWNNAASGQPDYDAQDLRGLINPFLSSGLYNSANKVRGGVLLTDGEDLRVVAPGNYTYQVKVGRAVIPATTAGEGSFTFYNDATFNGTLVTADTLPRLDAIYIRALSAEFGDTITGGVTGMIGVVKGTPASSPTTPGIPANSLLVGVIRVPTAGNPTTLERDAREWLTAPGGVVNTTEALLAGLLQRVPVGQLALCADTNRLYTRGPSAWVMLADPSSGNWTNLTLNPNYGTQDMTPQVKRVGDWVSCRGSFKRTAGGAISINGTPDPALVNIPVGFRPSGGNRIFTCAAVNSGGSREHQSVRAILGTNGNIIFDGWSGDANWPTWIDLSNISYYV